METARIRIGLIDDDNAFCQLVQKLCSNNNMECFFLSDPQRWPHFIESYGAFDLIMLDIQMNTVDGYRILREMRESNICTPIFMVSNLNGEYSKAICFELGADDYICKPIPQVELLARIKAQVRRFRSLSQQMLKQQDDVVRYEHFSIHYRLREVRKSGGEVVLLTDYEYLLLTTLASAPNVIMSREEIVKKSHNQSSFPDDRRIDILIHRLRNKLEPDAKKPIMFQTVRNKGYIFTAKRCDPGG